MHTPCPRRQSQISICRNRDPSLSSNHKCHGSDHLSELIALDTRRPITSDGSNHLSELIGV